MAEGRSTGPHDRVSRPKPPSAAIFFWGQSIKWLNFAFSPALGRLEAPTREAAEAIWARTPEREKSQLELRVRALPVSGGSFHVAQAFLLTCRAGRRRYGLKRFRGTGDWGDRVLVRLK